MIEVKNMRVEKPSNPWDIKVDRTSPLGNPFIMHTESERDSVCNQYEKWLSDMIASKNNIVCSEMNRLYKIYKQFNRLNLYCWCAPKRCHAETIKRLIEEVSNE